MRCVQNCICINNQRQKSAFQKMNGVIKANAMCTNNLRKINYY